MGAGENTINPKTRSPNTIQKEASRCTGPNESYQEVEKGPALVGDIIRAGGGRYEEESFGGWSWAGGARVAPSCRICCANTGERSDRYAGDQRHDLRFLRWHSAGCAGISEGCEGSESVAGKQRGDGDLRSRHREGGRLDQGGEKRSWHESLRREGQEEVNQARPGYALDGLPLPGGFLSTPSVTESGSFKSR
jgi:hypothetical protein